MAIHYPELDGNSMVLRTASEIEAERLEFKTDRIGHNDSIEGRRHPSRITYVTHAKGYVMARHPGARPFVITEELWRSFPLRKTRS